MEVYNATIDPSVSVVTTDSCDPRLPNTVVFGLLQSAELAEMSNNVTVFYPWESGSVGGAPSTNDMRASTGPIYCQIYADANAGPIYGGNDGVYTDDSPVQRAAIHAGIASHGQWTLVQVTWQPGTSTYPGSDAFGIRSGSSGPWPGGYTLSAVRRVPMRFVGGFFVQWNRRPVLDSAGDAPRESTFRIKMVVDANGRTFAAMQFPNVSENLSSLSRVSLPGNFRFEEEFNQPLGVGTNVGLPGTYYFRVDGGEMASGVCADFALRPTVTMWYGTQSRDASSKASDKTILVWLSKQYAYAGSVWNKLEISTSGYILLNGNIISPFGLPRDPRSVARAGDCDPRVSNRVFWRELTSAPDLQLVNTTLTSALGVLDGSVQQAFVVTWHRIAVEGTLSGTNTFQLVVAQTAGGTPILTFNYENLDVLSTANSTTGSQMFPNMTFLSKNRSVFTVGGEKNTSAAQMSRFTNVGTPGRWVYAVGTNFPTTGLCFFGKVTSSRTLNVPLFGGTVIPLDGFCVKKSVAVCRFEKSSWPSPVFVRGITGTASVLCHAPPSLDTGLATLRLSVDGGRSYSSLTYFDYQPLHRSSAFSVQPTFFSFPPSSSLPLRTPLLPSEYVGDYDPFTSMATGFSIQLNSAPATEVDVELWALGCSSARCNSTATDRATTRTLAPS